MMRSMQLKLVQIKQGLLDLSHIDTVRFNSDDSLTQSVCHFTTRWISSLGSTELKWVHNRVDPGFDSLVSSVGTSTHHLLI